MSRVQFNLLPSVKLEYIKAQSTRNKVTTISTIVTAVAIALLLVTVVFVEVIQKASLRSADNNISSAISDIKSETDITKIITVQNQLTTLSALHADKNITSRVFDYLSQLTPEGVNLSHLNIDYTNNSMLIDGTATSATQINKLVDTLKFAKYSVGKSGVPQTAFSSVVENNFSISSTSVSYSLSITYNPELFANNLKDGSGTITAPILDIPSQNTTRSSLFSGGQ